MSRLASGHGATIVAGVVAGATDEPFLNVAQARHPAFQRSVEVLTQAGVRVLLGPDVYPLHEPGTGSQYLDVYPWHLTLQALRR